MNALLDKIATRRILLPAFFICLFINLYFFRNFTQDLEQRSGEPLEVLDLRMGGYSLEDVASLFEKMGQEGRDGYTFITSVVDMIYPIAYGVLFIGLIIVLVKKVTHDKKGYLLGFIPMGIMLFDYLENFSTLRLLNIFPDLTASAVSMGSAFTQVKWAFMGIVIFFLLTFLFLWLGKNLLDKN